MRSLEADVARLNEERESVTARLVAARDRVEETGRDLDSWQDRWGQVAHQLEALQAQLSRQEESAALSAADLERKKGELIDLLGRLASARNRQVALESESRQLGESLRRVA